LGGKRKNTLYNLNVDPGDKRLEIICVDRQQVCSTGLIRGQRVNEIVNAPAANATFARVFKSFEYLLSGQVNENQIPGKIRDCFGASSASIRIPILPPVSAEKISESECVRV
jgi:hypothetical protein